MSYWYIDIETFGNKPEEKELTLPTRDDVKVGNIKNPELIEAKIKEVLPQMIAEAKAKHQDEFDKEWRGNALKSLKCEIIALCYAVDDGDVVKLKGTEKEIMEALEAALLRMPIEKVHQIHFVAHNGNEFDYPFLRHRAMKYGLKRLLSILPSGKYSDKHIDTQVLFRGSQWKEHYSLDAICKFFGLEGKDGIDGSMVHDYYLNGKIDDIVDYCADDVVKRLRPIHKIMSN